MINSEVKEILDGVAIIGLAGRFPGAANVDELWRNLCEGVESISFFDDNELDPSIDSQLKKNPNYVKARGIIEDSDKFDAAFFGIAPREAEIMDPQHRIFLETAWEALENAGYNPGSHNGLIGVYGGTGFNTYLLNNVYAHPNLIKLFGEHQTAIANGPDYVTTRVSYKLDLRGPSLSIYTGCSLSLVAVCLAYDSLMSFQCDMALAGGIFIHCPQNSGYLYQEGGIESADGHCRPFEARANGAVFSNGVGIVVLKRLADALEDGDQIYAVIRGTAMNNDGSMKMSFTAPSVDAQAEVIAMAYASAQVDPETISYIETHGTGTPVGDPIEIEALTKAFRANTSAKNFCAIGSIKSNIGHLDAAAGVAGLIKAALLLHHKLIPPSLHFKKPNPKIDFANSPFYINDKLLKWEKGSTPRRAGVTSLGVGGTNAHVILEESPKMKHSGPSRPWQLILLSTKTETALETATRNLVKHLKQYPHFNLADIAYTLQVGRKPFNHRRMVVCQDRDDAVTILEAMDPKRVFTSFQEPRNRDIVFMFPGGVAQYPNMGADLYRHEAVFREQVDNCLELLKQHLDSNIKHWLYPIEAQVKEAVEQLKKPSIGFPALFIIEYALAKLWMSWGIQPAALIGHSLGEYAAACLAGVISLEDALFLVTLRGRLFEQLPEGAMLSVPLSKSKAQNYMSKDLSFAAINGPSLCVVSGPTRAIEEMEEKLTKKDINCIRLIISVAAHSKMIDHILDEFSQEIKKIQFQAPNIPYASNLTGTWISKTESKNPQYWIKQLRHTVRFEEGLKVLLEEPHRVMLEIGPGRTLSALAKQHPNKGAEHVVLSSLRHPYESVSDVSFQLSTLGHLWMAGTQVNWRKFYAEEKRRRLPLPTYPFERKRYWLDGGKQEGTTDSTAPASSEELKNIPSSNQAQLDQTIEGTYDNTPKDEMEQTIANIWQDLLGVNPVNICDNFFDLGGSSFEALLMFAQIEKILGKKLPVSTLYQAPTVEQLASIFREKEWTESWSCLVEIQSNGSTPPLFLMHGAGGNVLLYRDLARHLGSNQPVYGLQSQGLDGKQPPLTRVEDMASLYLKEIQSFWPEGPYLLGGYCMGGTLALEIAQQLRAQGKDVALLIFLETYNFSNIKDMSLIDKTYYYIQKVGFHWRNFLLLESKDKWTFIEEKAKVAIGRRKVWWGMLTSKIGNILHRVNGQASILSKIWQINDDAALSYVPKPYAGEITQFVPIKEYAHHEGPELGWEKLALGGLETPQLPVYPAGMIVEPFVQLLAEKIKICIEKALEGKTSNKA